MPPIALIVHGQNLLPKIPKGPYTSERGQDTFVLVVVNTTVITVLCMPGSPYWSLARNKQAHNRWLVAYTLLRNPSLQELTASRIEEKKPQEVVATGEKDPELEAESPVSFSSATDIKQPLLSIVKEANFEVTS